MKRLLPVVLFASGCHLLLDFDSVPPPAPSALSYTAFEATYPKGQPIAANWPSSLGGPVDSYSITPRLPDGLSFDKTTGVISGTPTAPAARTSYTVTAMNLGGLTTTTLGITVSDVAPVELHYSVTTVIYIVGQPLSISAPSSTGGQVVSYSIAPPLPPGLSMDPTTGVISGIPTGPSSAMYAVTATNSGGSTTVTLLINIAMADANRTIAAGLGHTCALVNGSVHCWGWNGSGQLGDNSSNDSLVPVQVSGLTSGVQSIATGGTHTCAIIDGGVQCWGDNGLGQLGDNSSNNSVEPARVSGLTPGVQSITTGNSHTCAITNGGAQCWGNNAYGELGNNSDAGTSLVPVQVSSLTSGVQSIAAGTYYTCALVNGGVQCWGYNDHGQLGNDSTTNSPVPVQVSGLTSGVQSITAGGHHACAIADGGVWCWGWNGYGQLGSTSPTGLVPVQVSGLTSGVQSIAAGLFHTCALVNGGVQCWGANYYGQLGDDSSTGSSSVPVQVSGLTSGVQSIATRQHHTCALVDGGVWCWGANDYGQLGNNSTTPSRVPVQVSGL